MIFILERSVFDLVVYSITECLLESSSPKINKKTCQDKHENRQTKTTSPLERAQIDKGLIMFSLSIKKRKEKDVA